MILDMTYKQKRIFNPKNSKDVKCFKLFLETNKWPESGCPFILETPYLSVPHMIQDKMVKNILRV